MSVTRHLGLAARREGGRRPGRGERESLAVVSVAMSPLHNYRGNGWQWVRSCNREAEGTGRKWGRMVMERGH